MTSAFGYRSVAVPLGRLPTKVLEPVSFCLTTSAHIRAIAGRPCVVYDCVINPDTVASCLHGSSPADTVRYRDFIVNLCLDKLEQKYDLVLSRTRLCCRAPDRPSC